MLFIPTTWRRYAMTIDMIAIMTSQYRVYNASLSFLGCILLQFTA